MKNTLKTYFSAEACEAPHTFFFHMTKAGDWVLQFLKSEKKNSVS